MNRLSFQSFLPGSAGLLYDALLVGTPEGAVAGPHLWAGSSPGGVLQGYGLRSSGAPVSDGAARGIGGTGTPLLRDMDLADGQMTGTAGGALLSVTGMAGQLRLHPVAASGALSAGQAVTDTRGQPLGVSEVELFRIGGQTYMVAASAAREGLALYRMSDGLAQAQLLQEVEDAPKTTLSGVSDLLSLDLGGTRFVVSASASEDGLSVHAVTQNSLELRDSLGARDGLWVNGLEDIALLEAGGQSFVIAGSALSGTLAAVRINPMGVLFVEDILHDTLETRFGGVQALDTFQAAGRSFILAGGNDGGLALVELLPGGRLFHHQSLAQDTGWDIGHLQALDTAVTGDSLQVFASGSTVPGVARLTLSLQDLGAPQTGTGGHDRLTGGAGDDLLSGLWGNDTLLGGAGDDLIFAGPGADVMTGGAGEDIFVVTADGQTDRITDFQFGQDRIDLSDWGRIYDHRDLSFERADWGGRILWRGQQIDVQRDGGGAIPIDMWSQDDFRF